MAVPFESLNKDVDVAKVCAVRLIVTVLPSLVHRGRWIAIGGDGDDAHTDCSCRLVNTAALDVIADRGQFVVTAAAPPYQGPSPPTHLRGLPRLWFGLCEIFTL